MALCMIRTIYYQNHDADPYTRLGSVWNGDMLNLKTSVEREKDVQVFDVIKESGK